MLVLPAGATLAALGLLLVDHYTRTNELAVWLASAALLVGVGRFVLTFRANLRMLQRSEREATTDALTGLGNRRALTLDLEHAAAGGSPQVLALYDLDGFKSYNDAFGHVAGDVLLERLGSNLAKAIAGHGTAYRMGGDEFCVLARVGDARSVGGRRAGRGRARRARRALPRRLLVRHGPCSTASGSTRRRRCASPTSGCTRTSAAGGQTSEETVHQVLLSVVGEHDGALRDHVDDVARLAEQVGRRLGLDDGDVAHLRRAAALHDVGKIAIPDDILHAPRPLSPEEWDYMRQHTVIGARIIAAAPELLPRRRTSCARATSAGTAAATPTAWRATRSRSARGSSRSATPSTR